ncbi:MAG: hypothetical protein PV344_07925, partial [Anaplasma sp.]|nr:hypothetical protein [Anaplasma sp.]
KTLKKGRYSELVLLIQREFGLPLQRCDESLDVQLGTRGAKTRAAEPRDSGFNNHSLPVSIWMSIVPARVRVSLLRGTR